MTWRENPAHREDRQSWVLSRRGHWLWLAVCVLILVAILASGKYVAGAVFLALMILAEVFRHHLPGASDPQ